MVSFFTIQVTNSLRDESSDFFIVPVFLYTNLLEAHLFQNLSHLCSYNEAKPVLVKRKSTARLVYLEIFFHTIFLDQIKIFKLSIFVNVYVAGNCGNRAFSEMTWHIRKCLEFLQFPATYIQSFIFLETL
jgi:hypothetical protein